MVGKLQGTPKLLEMVDKNEDVAMEVRPPIRMKPKPPGNKKDKAKKMVLKPGAPIPAARDDQCHFFVERKRRYCNLGITPGKNYCGQHMHMDPDGLGDDRILCPYDGGHTVKKSELDRHLKRCNARPTQVEQWCTKNLNLVRPFPPVDAQGNPVEKRLSPKDFDRDEFFALCEWLRKRYNRNITEYPIVQDFQVHKSLESKIMQQTKPKHATQQASLIAHMDSNGMLAGDKTFMEFGAGKGELTRWVWTATSPEVETSSQDSNCANNSITQKSSSDEHKRYILVDRCNFRKKFDFYVTHGVTDMSEKRAQGADRRATARVDRILSDIRDLNIEAIPDIHSSPLVGISKHLCGSATDMTLLSLANYIKSGGEVQGAIIAVCCHHVCDYSSCLADDISKREYEFLRSIAAWATCAWKPKNGADRDGADADVDDDEHATDIDQEDPTNDNSVEEHWSKMNQEEREQLGFMAKRVVDFGRKKFLESLGFNVKLIYFVDRSISLENAALVATMNK